MEPIEPGIWRVLPSKATERKYVSFYVARPEGGLLFPCFSNQSTIAERFAAIAAEGGIVAQLLGDSHFRTAHCDEVAEQFDAPLYCSEPEAEEVRRKVERVVTFPFERHTLLRGLEVIPTPGHRPGGVCYRLEHGGRRHLFAGDAIWHDGEDWRTLPSSKGRRKLIASLEALAAIPFDVLYCNSTVANPVYRRELDDAERRAFLLEQADRIRG